MHLVASGDLFVDVIVVIVMALVVVVYIAATKGSVWQLWECSDEPKPRPKRFWVESL